MKMCERFKCKRLALGLTQSELGKLLGVSRTTISNFENGEEMSQETFEKITNGLEEYITSFDPDTYTRIRILQEAYQIRYETNTKYLALTLNHISIHANKMCMDIIRNDEGEA